MSKRAKIISAVVVIVVIIIVGGFFGMQARGAGVEVQTSTVATTKLAVTVTASGKIAAGGSQAVYPASAGTLAEVYVSDGETVSAGQKLAMLDTAPLELQLAQAKAGLAQAQAQLKNVGAQGVSSADITAAKAGVTAAKSAYSAASLAYSQASDAYDAAKLVAEANPTSATAQAALSSASLAKSQAKSGKDAAYSGVKQAEAGLVKAQAANPSSQKSAAQAGVSQAAQAVAMANDAIDKATLVAPMDGVVLFNALGQPGADGETPVAAEGAAVAPQSPMFTVVDLNGTVFTAEVDEADIARITPQMVGGVTLDAYAGKEFPTKVVTIGRAAKPTATGGTIFPVDLSMDGIDVSVLLGMKGDAKIEVSALPDATTIPVEALFNENGKNFVYVVENNKLVKTDVTVGATTDTEVQIIKGVKAGQVVALSGPTQFTDGMTVRVKN